MYPLDASDYGLAIPVFTDITTPVNVTFDDITSDASLAYNELRWRLGSTDTTDYTDICMPAGSQLDFTIQIEIDPSTLDNTGFLNTISVADTSGAIEDELENNTSSSDFMVYRPEVYVSKEGVSCGDDNTCANTDDDAYYTQE